MSDMTLDDLQNTLVDYAHGLYEAYDLSDKDMLILLDTFKFFAGEYSKLVQAGEVSEEQQYKHDYAKGLDNMNEYLSKLADEEL